METRLTKIQKFKMSLWIIGFIFFIVMSTLAVSFGIVLSRTKKIDLNSVITNTKLGFIDNNEPNTIINKVFELNPNAKDLSLKVDEFQIKDDYAIVYALNSNYSKNVKVSFELAIDLATLLEENPFLPVDKWNENNSDIDILKIIDEMYGEQLKDENGEKLPLEVIDKNINAKTVTIKTTKEGYFGKIVFYFLEKPSNN
ncbi:hypothetical protein STIUS_v1c02700 [Spiroplasma sp. TIUS-1]|uniref:hypothetical protein n=1 Tax=Spiroplasma sp. TIUS-1 TaxID=216963 RepID=UPI0013983938|nr:hypothetical protein [Spiroplasma sp. TIUS-1]QHX35824.1 hypothetical protein STIUS_v1c02700 [Spiroplasma sp. TIUS-1]